MISRLNGALFTKEIDARNIAWFRILFCLSLFFQVLKDTSANFYDIANHPDFNPIPLFEFLRIGRPTTEMFVVGYIAFLVLLLACLQKKYLRFFLIASTLLSFWIFGSELSLTKPINTNYVFHSKNIIVFILFLLAVSPGTSHLGAASVFRKSDHFLKTQIWPITLIKFSLAAVYFGAAYCRLVSSGFEWANGNTLQAYLYEHYLLLDIPQALWLAKQHTLCMVLSVGVLLFEFTFLFFVFTKRASILFAIGGLLLHFGTFYFMEINFFKYHALSYLIFLERKWFLGAK